MGKDWQKTALATVLSVLLTGIVVSGCAPSSPSPTPGLSTPTQTAAPVPVAYTLSAEVRPVGAGSVSPSSGQYEQGKQINVTATPSAGYTFSQWSGDASGSSLTVTITMDSNKTLVAHFRDITPPVISEVRAADITETSATITWATNEFATSQVEYGKTSGYGFKSPLHDKPVTSHDLTLSDLEPNTAYHFRVRSKDSTGNEAVSGDNIFSTATPDIKANISIDFSWHLESNYTSVPTYISNQSGYSTDVVIRIKAFNLQNVTLYDNSFTLNDILPGETYFKPFNVTGTDTANVEVSLTDAYPTQFPPTSKRTDLVILNELPTTVEQEKAFNVDIRNDSNNQLSVRVKVRWYDSEGYLRGASVTSFLGSIEPSETKRFRWGAMSMWPNYKYYVYLVD